MKSRKRSSDTLVPWFVRVTVNIGPHVTGVFGPADYFMVSTPLLHAAVLLLQTRTAVSDYPYPNNSTTHAKLAGPLKSYVESFVPLCPPLIYPLK